MGLIGTRTYGCAVLEATLKAGHDVAWVSAPTDDKVAAAAIRAGVTWIPEAGPGSAGQVDVVVCAHSHQYLGRRTRSASTLGAIGYHPSLLPRHRGRDAVRWTVAFKDPIAGGSVYWLDNGVDTGPIAAQRWLHVDPKWGVSDLWRRLLPIGVDLTLKVLSDLDRGVVVSVDQDERVATWEPSWERPPLHRPELPEIGPMPDGFTVRKRLWQD